MESTTAAVGVTGAASEAELYPIMQADWTQQGHRLFRNNVGQAWVGRVFARHGRRVTLDAASKIAFGLAHGSGDLIGWTSIRVTPDMVGHDIAVFTSCECKTYAPSSTLHGKQKNWFNAVRAAGGLAFVARSVQDGRDAVTHYLNRFSFFGPRHR